jgi:truncated hemoglobin YjbI
MKCRACWLLVALIVVGCMEGQKKAPLPRKPSLYTDLGGDAKLEVVVDKFVERAAASSRLREPIRAAFQGEDTTDLKRQLVRRLGAALGGPYPGTKKDLQQFLVSLAGSEEVNAEDMNVLLGLLDQAMKDAGVGRARKEVMTSLEEVRTLPSSKND